MSFISSWCGLRRKKVKRSQSNPAIDAVPQPPTKALSRERLSTKQEIGTSIIAVSQRANSANDERKALAREPLVLAERRQASVRQPSALVSDQRPSIPVQPSIPVPPSVSTQQPPLPAPQPSFPAQAQQPSILAHQTSVTLQGKNWRQWQLDWEDWIQNESRSLPHRQYEFMQRKRTPFVQITRTNACNFYDIESDEMDDALPYRTFQHHEGGGCAFEHKAVRRLAYLKKAYLSGWHQMLFTEEQLYEKGRELFNEQHDERIRVARMQGDTFPPITIFLRNNNNFKNFGYQKIETRYNPHVHDEYD